MKSMKLVALTLPTLVLALPVLAQNSPPRGGPPPQAFEDCRGKAAGAVVQHMTREGTVQAICEQTSEGLVARPGQSRTAPEITPKPVTPTSGFVLTTTAGAAGGTLPVEYSCDGAGASPALQWLNPPAGTKEYALMITTIPVDGSTRWNWVLHGIPGSTIGLAKSARGIGVLGATSHDNSVRYEPPCPNGPGAKRYTFTLYALSATPVLPSDPRLVTGAVLTKAIAGITLGAASFEMSYARK